MPPDRRRLRRSETERAGYALEELAGTVANWTGGSLAFAVAVSLIVIWAASGPYFHYSDTWQLVINTGTTVVTFLMVFLIQRSQNKDARAVHLKLNEIVAALQGASNRLINVEDLTEAEVRALHQRYERLVEAVDRDPEPEVCVETEGHSAE
jgi:low affinity Fe/Cu permease